MAYLPTGCDSEPEARACILEVGPGILGLAPAHRWIELAPGVSGCRTLGAPGLAPVHGVWGQGLSALVARASVGSLGLKVASLLVNGAMLTQLAAWLEASRTPTYMLLGRNKDVSCR